MKKNFLAVKPRLEHIVYYLTNQLKWERDLNPLLAFTALQ
jgi:hypothetical protein